MDSVTCDQHVETNNDYPLSDYEWVWDEKNSTSSIKLSDDNLNVTFHPVYSTGTAVVKGSKPLEKERHHFWEISMITHIYGTDVMIGVGTPNAELHDASQDFCALLGRDKESWGFSYKGYLQHDGKIYKYGSTFGQDNSIGIHLDTWRGVAFTMLNNVTLYPLVSSTMAQCTMKLTYTCSIPVSLQTTCLPILSPSQKTYLSKTIPGLRYLIQNIFVDILKKPTDNEDEEEMEYPAKYVILDDFDYALVGFKKLKKKR
ncbi:SPRY domain-containing SOCS box protein 3-like isoform X2 [Pogonomyrmex barbatus]|uniref:SPRY domain-containing SOCS box protein 3-like isoform X2 n=1 Tax=Pogonomyrmex barbatus TaxID=144034 RepID=A0A6I9XBI2_9HYME|nr:SPRY domain-containing SOCS box protein 3-like isoform X2 [Pogonomyrmex barbatus]